MEWTLGALMFYGGLCGALVTLIVSVIVLAVLKKSRKGIVSKLNAEYGGDLR